MIQPPTLAKRSITPRWPTSTDPASSLSHRASRLERRRSFPSTAASIIAIKRRRPSMWSAAALLPLFRGGPHHSILGEAQKRPPRLLREPPTTNPLKQNPANLVTIEHSRGNPLLLGLHRT